MHALIINESKKGIYQKIKSQNYFSDDNSAKISIKAAGLCGSDIQKLFNNNFFFKKDQIIGHEFTGVIERVPKNEMNLKKGTKVVGIPLIPCGKCIYCLKKLYQFCTKLQSIGKELPGAFADKINIPIYNIRILPDYIDYFLGTLTDVIAVAIHTYHIADSPKNKNILIIGDGSLALCCLKIFQKENNVSILGKYKYNLDIALEFGSNKIYNLKQIKQLPTNNYDIIIECVGREQDITIRKCVELIKIRGKIIVTGVFPLEYYGNIHFRELFYKESILMGVNSYSYFGLINEFDLALKELLRFSNEYKKIITHIYPLSSFNKAVEELKNKEINKIIKIVFYPE